MQAFFYGNIIISCPFLQQVQQLLQQQGINFSADQIFGKEVKQPKTASLRQIKQDAVIWFVEDRLKTLQSVLAQPDLTDIRLFLADWGYNTPADRALADSQPQIQLLSIDQFAQDFSQW